MVQTKIEMNVGKGKPFKPLEKTKNAKMTIAILPTIYKRMDALFSNTLVSIIFH